MARKLNQEEANAFGQSGVSSQTDTELSNDQKLLEALKRQSLQSLELSPELQFWLEQAFPVKLS